MSRTRLAIAGCLTFALLAASSCDEGLPTDPEQFLALLEQSGSWPDTLDAGERQTLHTSVTVNQLTVTGAEVQWTVSAPTILSVDTLTTADSTAIRGLRPGTARVTATLVDEALTEQSTNQDITVRLRGVRVAAPGVDTTVTSLGDTVLVRAAGLTNTGEDVDSSGVTFNATGAALTTVDQAPDSLWLASAANGTSRIIVSHTLCVGKCADTVLVTVQQVPVTVEAPDTIRVGRLNHARGLQAPVLDANRFAVADSVARWSVVSGAEFITLEQDGTLTGVANGTASVAASVRGAADTAVVEVEQAVASANVTDSLITFGAVALEDTVVVELADSSAVAIERQVSVTWGSSNTAAVTVEPLVGDSTRAMIRSIAIGESYVRATAEGQRDSVLVRVTQTAASVSVAPAADTLNALGDTVELAATARDGNEQVIPDAVVVWTSLDTLVATVDGEGDVVAAGQGTARIAATSGEAADTAQILVRQIPASVQVSGTVDSLAAGDTTTFVAAVADSNGNTVAEPTVAWSSSDESVAVVDHNGLVTGAGTGTATITATSEPASGQRDITVTGLVVDAVRITPDSIHFDALGDTLTADGDALNPQGNPIPGVEITWSSTDEAVATVDSNGLVTSVADGTATLIATADSKADTVPVVVSQQVAVVSVAPETKTFTALTDTATFTATVTDAVGTVVAGAVVTWSSKEALVATVSGAGLVTSVTDGTTYVVAVSSGVRDSAQVTVAQAVDSVGVTPVADTLTAVGDTLRLTAEVLDGRGQAAGSPEWASRDTSVVTVSNTGLVTAVANGTTWVVAARGGVADSSRITVAQAVASVTVTPNTPTLTSIGDTVQLSASIEDAGGTVVADSTASWSSLDTLVATVNASGLVTAVANGTAGIVAVSGGVDDTATVTVNQTVANVDVAPATRTFTALTDTATFTASVTDALGSAVTGAAVTWSSKDTLIATVSAAGLVTSVGDGTTYVVAVSSGVRDSAQVTVAQAVASVVVTPEVDTLTFVGDTAQLALSVTDAQGQDVAGASTTWTSRDTAVTTVDSTGTVTAVANGSAWVVAEAGSAADSSQITVEQAVASVSTTPANATLNSLGETLQVNASILDAGGAAVAGASATWSSTDTLVATVSASGLVTAVANGNAKVIASADSQADTTDITVNQTVATLVVTPADTTLTSKVDSVQLATAATDALGNPVAGAAVTYNALVGNVGVDANGLVVSNSVGADSVVATSGSAADTAVITITQVVGSLVISPAVDTIAVRAQTVLTVAATDSNGYSIASPSVTWASLFTDTATVAGAGTSATVTGEDGGTGIITATSGTAVDSATILVKEYAFDFDGTDDYAQVATGVDLSAAADSVWTIELWARPDAATGDEYLVVREDAVGGGNLEYAVLLRNGKPMLAVRTGGGPGSEYQLVANNAISTATWHHIAFTYSTNTGAKLYVDGSQDTDVTTSGALAVAKGKGTATMFGAYGTTAGDGNFDGGLDEIRFWSVVRSATEIATNRAVRLVGSEADLRAYWPLDAGTGNGVELTGNGPSAAAPTGTTWSTDVPPIH